MEEELDYMSDDFVKSCTGLINDVRPGLIKSQKEKREHQLLKKKKLTTESQKKPDEREILEESLKQPINSSNKGFSMLQKMGFKTGTGLGKNNTGIVEPIGIKIKTNKSGLGHKVKIKPKINVDSLSADDYRAFLSKKNREKEMEIDFRKSQRICKILDLKCDKSEPEKAWFWPKDETEEVLNDDSEDEDLELKICEKLETLTRYLRDKYYYCVWCKVQYNDEKDLEDCPGDTKDDH